MTPGPEPQFDAEAMFAYWYGDGNRRTYQQVADQFGAGYSTVKRYASENDWDGRADELDEDVRKVVNKKLAGLRARALNQEMQMLATLEARFARRLVPGSEHELRPEEIGISEFEKIVKLRALLSGDATARVDSQERERSLEEIDAEIAALEAAETGVEVAD